MKPCLLDACVWLAARNSFERDHHAARALVERAEKRPFAALDLTLYEVANIAVRSWRSTESARRLTKLVRGACAGNIVRVDDQMIERAIQLAETHELTAYDAAYVAAAELYDWTLVSGDYADLVTPGLALSPDAALAVAE